MKKPEPFRIEIADAVLDDLRDRLGRTRPAPAFSDDGWDHGVDAGFLRSLLDHWRTGFDWRRHEAHLNRVPHYRVEFDGVPLHFIHVRGRGPARVPLLLLHGWPWTFFDFDRVLEPLAEDFDLVVPSLPGFGFSAPLDRSINFWETAPLLRTLMTEVLGYDRFAVHGADWGARIAAELGHRFASDIVGLHLTWTPTLDRYNAERPWETGLRVDTASPEQLDLERRTAGHVATHILDPQTLAAALNDSPAGLCAWILQRRRHWSDGGGDVERVFSKDDLLTTMTLYWASETIGPSMRYYREATLRPWRPAHGRSPIVEVPVTVSSFAADPAPVLPPGPLEHWYDITWIRHHPRGGHFAAWEQPAAVVADLCASFRPTLDRLFELLDARRSDALLDLLSDDVQWVTPSAEADGKEAVARYLAGLGASSGRHVLTRHNTDGDMVMAEGYREPPADGRKFVASADLGPDGRITRFVVDTVRSSI